MNGLSFGDIDFLLIGAVRSFNISFWTILIGTPLAILLGWVRASAPKPVSLVLGAYTDLHRSIPLVVQLILFNSLIGALFFPMDPFTAGLIILILYYAAFAGEVVRGGILSVHRVTRMAGRSIGLSYRQDLAYIVFPLAVRTMLPSWISVVLGVIKDSALVAAIGYIELLRASQIVITRTLNPLAVLAIAGLIYFLICWPISVMSSRLERRFQL
ncbi:Polar amino acid transport system permease protein OS=Castellaniella defragrans OX=75697 GN=HNR28_002471 PE=3 SV=1 [Castellaniella defragrans]